MKKATLLLALAAIFTFAACGDKNTCDTTGVTYNTDIKSIYDQNCATAGCHNAGAVDGSLANFADAKAFANNDKLLASIKHAAGASAMPKGSSKLSDCDISKIEAWFTAGKPE